MLRLWQKSSFMYNCLMINTVIKLFTSGVLALIDSSTVLLNSCERCAANKHYEVTSDVDYHVNVTNDANQSCPWECTASFISTRNNSWLCVAQVGLESYIKDSNGELLVYDNAHHISHLVEIKYYPRIWKEREICAKSSQINFNLKKVNPKLRIDFGKLRLQFNVLDIESTNRTAYLNDTYCGTKYKLLNSQISIYNQPEVDDQVSLDSTLTSLCGIEFEMVDVNQDTDKRICFLYKPLDQVDCRSGWNFSVSIAGFSIMPKDMAYTLNCNDQKSQEVHSWCADKGTHKITLVFQRNENVPNTAEYAKMFRFIFRDYNGTAESLKNEWKMYEEQNKPPDDTSSKSNGIWVSILVVVVLIVIAVGAFLCRNKIFLLFKQYGPVHNPVKKENKRRTFQDQAT